MFIVEDMAQIYQLIAKDLPEVFLLLFASKIQFMRVE